MTNYDEQERIPVPRTRIFVLVDGTFVVQWEENRVQALMTGRYSNFENEMFGTAITDYELTQLKNSGIVDHYDEELVYLSPLASIAAQLPTRSYYLNTTLHKSRMKEVQEFLDEAGLSERYSVRVQEIFVIIRGPAGMPFVSFDEAEIVREQLVAAFPESLQDMVVAFVEVNPVH